MLPSFCTGMMAWWHDAACPQQHSARNMLHPPRGKSWMGQPSPTPESLLPLSATSVYAKMEWSPSNNQSKVHERGRRQTDRLRYDKIRVGCNNSRRCSNSILGSICEGKQTLKMAEGLVTWRGTPLCSIHWRLPTYQLSFELDKPQITFRGLTNARPAWLGKLSRGVKIITDHVKVNSGVESDSSVVSGDFTRLNRSQVFTLTQLLYACNNYYTCSSSCSSSRIVVVVAAAPAAVVVVTVVLAISLHARTVPRYSR